MQALERRRVGAFGIDQAATIGELEAAVRDGTVGDRVVSIDEALRDVPAAEVDPETAERVCHGVALPAARVARWLGVCRAGGLVRIRSNGVTVALATAPADHATLTSRESGAVLKVDRVLRDRVSKVSSDQGVSQGPARSR
jgi:tRNA U55 pseudouridine synthase TruB